MRQRIAILAFSLSVLFAAADARAQARDSVFPDYAAYADFVDGHVMNRDFIPLIQSLGGRDEYTIEQLNGINGQLLGAWPRDFGNVSVFREEDLGGGVRQEGRLY